MKSKENKGKAITKGKSSAVMPDSPTEVQPVNPRLRRDWNEYIAYLQSKGLKGDPSLDKDNMGLKMIEEYRKVNPNTTVSKDTVTPIQEEFKKYREWTLGEIKAGRARLADGVKPEDYMKALSIVDGIPGQRTTSFVFPEAYLKTLDADKNVVNTQNQGFAKAY